jgi:flagellar hook-associated protein 3 FlgL
MPSADYRISNQMLVTQSLTNLGQNVSKMAELQDRASSLKRLRRPSDAPADVASAMALHGDLNRNDQLLRNIDDAMAWMGTADSALTSAVEQLERVRQLAVQARNASMDATSREAIATEIDDIRKTVLGFANAQYAGRPVFGGTASGAVAYQADGTYVGFSAAVERTVAPGQQVQVNVNGDDVFGGTGNDIFTTLAQISGAVRSNPSDLEALSSTLQTKTQRVQSQLGQLGARFQRVTALQNQNQADAVTMKKNLSNIEDVDLAEVMMQLQTQQVAYQAALAATARALQPSLADFLR